MPARRDLADLFAAASLSALLFAVPVLLVPALAPAAGAPPLPPVAREVALVFQLLAPLAGFFAAAPLICLAARNGTLPGALGAVLSIAALLPLVPLPVAAIYAIEHALPALYLGRRLAAGRPVAAGSALAAVVVAALLAASAFLLLGAPGRDPLAPLEAQLREGLAAMQTGGDAVAPPTGAPTVLPQDFEAAFALLRRVLPAVTVIGIFLECALNSLFALRVLNARAPALPAPDLTRFALPEWLTWVLIATLALCWAPSGAVSTVALNAVLPLLLAYLLQGLSIVLHFAARANLSRLGRTLLAVAFGVFPWLLAGPLLLGLLDFRFAFRSRPAVAAPGA